MANYGYGDLSGLFGDKYSTQATLNDALMQSQGLMDMERARGQQDLSTATAMGGLQVPWADLGRLQGQGTHTKNVEGVSGASRNIFGQQSAQSMGKAKQKQGIWDMLLGGGGGGGGFLGGLFG